MMIIVSKKMNIPGKYMSMEEFWQKATSEEGLDVSDSLIFNINEIEDKKQLDMLIGSGLDQFFSVTGTVPEWCNVHVEDWYEKNLQHSDEGDGNKKAESYKPEGESKNLDPNFEDTIANLLNDSSSADEAGTSDEGGGARVVVFGSSKGGTGKTFTSIISTYRYAKKNPHQRIALVDFDIIDGQVGISIHKVKPTMRSYLTEYQKGYKDFKTLKNFSVRSPSSTFPQNIDFYLAPNSGTVIKDGDFWLNIMQNVIDNYDLVVFDTGIDYLNIRPISYAYQIADKINLVTTTSIKSVNSVIKQISKLKGETKNNIYQESDELLPKLNLIITQMVESDEMNETIYNTLSAKCNVVATFGVINDSVAQAEYYGFWNIFDKNKKINEGLDNIMS